MTREELSRTEMLLGTAAVEKLAGSRVAVFGIGGVGGYVVEALARSGVGALDLIDPDRIAPSNLNRQIIALHSTVGEFKVDVARERVLDINPDATVTTYKTFFTPETAGEFDFSAYDCVVDAIDTVTGKIELAVRCRDAGTPLISSMGTGNKTDPSALRAADISKTSVCPLARVMRRELRKRGITHLRVVYSEEQPLAPQDVESAEKPSPGRRQTPGSCAFVPPAAGLIIAGEVAGILINRK
ncbi:MAG: tRNA threonylcarbamoyladenosine dehydratase [Clostridia bacterium]|nr:tRNA threonylcarbamoyladenosine dehydratase [Clostridia bacterium]